eukprot:scaffold45043_cov63-Phaeocystis_antarctica.AAC.7
MQPHLVPPVTTHALVVRTAAFSPRWNDAVSRLSRLKACGATVRGTRLARVRGTYSTASPGQAALCLRYVHPTGGRYA